MEERRSSGTRNAGPTGQGKRAASLAAAAKPAGASRADAQRDRVLQAAVEIFSLRGYRGTSMIDIANEVGLSKPTLYHYFRSKEELLVRLYEDVLEESLRVAREIVEAGPTPGEALEALLVHRVVYTCEHQDLLKVFFEEEAELPKALAKTVLVKRHEFEELVGDLVSAHVEGAVDVLDASLSVYVNVLLGAVNWTYKWFNPKGPLGAKELGQQIAATLLATLPPARTGARVSRG